MKKSTDRIKGNEKTSTTQVSPVPARAISPEDDNGVLRCSISMPQPHKRALKIMMAADRRNKVSDMVRVMVEDEAVRRNVGQMVNGELVLCKEPPKAKS